MHQSTLQYLLLKDNLDIHYIYELYVICLTFALQFGLPVSVNVTSPHLPQY